LQPKTRVPLQEFAPATIWMQKENSYGPSKL